jgi:DNA-binding NarL/FixJ family response regulator
MNSKNQKTAPKTRIFIVDDHPMMREGLAQLISSQADMEVCGQAGNADAALENIKLLGPDLVLVDITLPGRSGLELIKDIHALNPAILILVLSMHEESLYAERVLRAGGRGYLMKHESPRKITEAIRRVVAGQIFVSENMSAKILEIFSGHHSQSAHSSVETLSEREFQVFQAIGRGMETKELAQHLHISPKTIEVHRANIKAKLRIKSIGELIRFAVRWVDAEKP